MGGGTASLFGGGQALGAMGIPTGGSAFPWKMLGKAAGQAAQGMEGDEQQPPPPMPLPQNNQPQQNFADLFSQRMGGLAGGGGMGGVLDPMTMQMLMMRQKRGMR
jgi:hypothetical protein